MHLLRRLTILSLCLSFPLWAAQAAELATTDVSLFDEALEVSKQFDPDVDAAACRQTFKGMVGKIKAKLDLAQTVTAEGALTPADVVALLNREILVSREVSYISHKYWRDSLFTSALTKNRGNCASTALLYYLIAQELKLPVFMAFAPHHAYVRWDDGKTVINIETTNKGAGHSDQALMKRFDLSEPDLKPNGFLLTLSDKQIRSRMRALWSGMFFSMEKRDEAHRYLAKAHEDDADAPELKLHDAQYLLFEGQAEKAKAIFESSLQSAVGPWAKAAAQLAMAEYLQTRGKFEEATLLLSKAFDDAPKRMKLEMAGRLGAYYRQKRQFDEAIPFYQFIATSQPDEHAYNNLGSVYSEARRNDEAIECFEKSRDMNPESFFSQIELVVLYDRIGDKDKSREVLGKLEEPRDSKLSWHRCMAFCLANLKDERKMIEHMAAAFKIDASGSTYQYFTREQDMDPYRAHAEFKKLMERHKPMVDGAGD
jgi:tetratricopeptide (TPR) repeat protein